MLKMSQWRGLIMLHHDLQLTCAVAGTTLPHALLDTACVRGLRGIQHADLSQTTERARTRLEQRLYGRTTSYNFRFGYYLA